MFNKFEYLIVVLILVISAFLIGNAWSLRIPLPPTLSNPLDEGQIASLNKYLKDIWDIQNGRIELDIVTTSKSAAKEGEIWIYNNSGSYSIQVKAGGVVRSTALTP